MRDDREKLQDILDAIERIERYAIQGRQAFEQNELIQTWLSRTTNPETECRSYFAIAVTWSNQN